MHPRHLLLLVSACFAATGCATVNSPLGEIFSVKDEQVAEEPQRPDVQRPDVQRPDVAPPAEIPSFVVEMRGKNNESQKFKRPLADEGTYIQGVLVQSNALKHFGRVKIQLWRPLPDGNGYHKLEIPFDRKKRTVPPAYDYALREGDRLIFMEDESTILDDMLESIKPG